MNNADDSKKDEQLQQKIAQLSALSHILNDESFEDWTDLIKKPLQQLSKDLGKEIAGLSAV